MKRVCLWAQIAIISAVSVAADPQISRPHYDFILNCQGCHRADGSATPGSVPPIKDHVARFLGVPGGREFIIRVPGVAAAPLSDDAIANLMNWLLVQFDSAHMPADFSPYSTAEVHQLRRRPLTGEVGQVRAALVAVMVGPAARK